MQLLALAYFKCYIKFNLPYNWFGRIETYSSFWPSNTRVQGTSFRETKVFQRLGFKITLLKILTM